MSMPHVVWQFSQMKYVLSPASWAVSRGEPQSGQAFGDANAVLKSSSAECDAAMVLIELRQHRDTKGPTSRNRA